MKWVSEMATENPTLRYAELAGHRSAIMIITRINIETVISQYGSELPDGALRILSEALVTLGETAPGEFTPPF